MATASDVYNELIEYGDLETFSPEQLLSACDIGLNWVNQRLRSGVSETDPLIAQTAAAIAHYYFFAKRLTETDKYESYKAGDMTINRNTEKELRLEEELKNQAIARAAGILVDGEFFFRGS